MLPFPQLDPIAVQLGPFAVRWYGLAYVSGILLAWWWMHRQTQRHGKFCNADQVGDLVFYAALGMILGGRLGYILFYNFSGYLAAPLDMFKVWQGGMSFHGGLIGALAACALWARHHGKGFLRTIDFVAPTVPIGLFFGRLANFSNAELWGAPTAAAWGVLFPGSEVPRHPTQLYEAALEGVVLFFILQFYVRRARAAGQVAGCFLLGYGVFRFAVEWLREPDAQLGYLAWGWLTMGQVLCVPMLIAGAWLMWRPPASGSAA